MPQTIRIGSLFTGYGGLDMATAQALNQPTRLAYTCDIEPGPRLVIHHHHPDTPNLGDITKVDWTQTPAVDVICGGSPCQSLSLAGQRHGMRPGTRSGLWSYQADAVSIQHPRLMVWENVQGALSAPAASAYDTTQPATLTAIGRVLGDLANLHYDAMWRLIEAAHIGAPHHRKRLFLIAWPTDTHPTTPITNPLAEWNPQLDTWIQGTDLFNQPVTFTTPWPTTGRMTHGQITPLPDPTGPHATPPRLFGTPQATDALSEKRTTAQGTRTTALGTQINRLFATPTANLSDRGPTPPDKRHSIGLDTQILFMLPTPTSRDVHGPNQRNDDTCLPGALTHHMQQGFGPYTPAVRHWERTLGRPAPYPSTIPHTTATRIHTLPQGVTDPTLTRRLIRHQGQFNWPLTGLQTPGFQKLARQFNRYAPDPCFRFNPTPHDVTPLPASVLPAPVVLHEWSAIWQTQHGRIPSLRQLNPRFVEWMMGLPDGWVTDPNLYDDATPPARRRLQLRMLGNGVVPQQGAAAIRWLLTQRDRLAS